MLNNDTLLTVFTMLLELYPVEHDKPLKQDVWNTFCGLLLTENEDDLFYDVQKLTPEIQDLMISSLLAWEAEHGYQIPSICQLFCVITSKSCEE
jgi:hypothetical protein